MRHGNRRSWRWAWLLPVFVAVLAAQTSMSSGPFAIENFSATMVFNGPQGEVSQKIYKLGDKIRMEMPRRAGAYSIMDLSAHKMYMVMSPQMCMEMDTTHRPGAPDPFAPRGTVKREPLGSETVDGHPCKVERITVTPAEGGAPVVMKAWEAQDLQGFPVRVETQTERGPMRIDYRDISLAPPAAQLMTPPQNCRAMPAMPAMPPH